jgi:hypothetical protein
MMGYGIMVLFVGWYAIQVGINMYNTLYVCLLTVFQFATDSLIIRYEVRLG